MAETNENGKPRRKRRTRAHVVEDLSENHLERFVLLNGHVLRRPERDYGVDVTMFHFGDTGEIENGEVRFQLKATESLNIIHQGSMISFPIETRDLHYWASEIYPFILVVFEATTENAFWLHIQQYISHNPERIDPQKSNVNVHIPVANQLTINSVDAFRRMSLEIVEQLRNHGGFPDVKRKPR